MQNRSSVCSLMSPSLVTWSVIHASMHQPPSLVLSLESRHNHTETIARAAIICVTEMNYLQKSPCVVDSDSQKSTGVS